MCMSCTHGCTVAITLTRTNLRGEQRKGAGDKIKVTFVHSEPAVESSLVKKFL